MKFLYILPVIAVIFIPRTFANPEPVFPEKELGTRMAIDITSHKHYDRLPSIRECGSSVALKVPEGKKNKRPKRVVGGKPLMKGKAPWMVQLYLHNISSGRSEFHCGGSLITRNVILTAAHCVTRIGSGFSLSAVMYGEVDRRNVKICETELETNCSREKQREIEETVIHEHYSEGNLQNDIALIKLSGGLEFNYDETTTASPICLPYSEELLKQWTDDTDLTAVGWGTQNKFNDPGPKQLSSILEEVKIPLRKRAYCNKFHTRSYGKLSSSRFCAGGGEAGKDTCLGDSGGAVSYPLMLNGHEKYFQFGIVSSGHVSTCGWQGRPSIYTNVVYFMPWILDHLGHKRASEVPLNSIYTDNDKKYTSKLSTGLDIDESYNPLSALLPDILRCGLWKPTRTNDYKDPEPADKEMDRPKRVVGGRPTGGIASFPWMAQIYVRDSMTNVPFLRCGGTVIHNRYILTSASCVTEIGSQFTLDSIILGNYDRNSSKECYDPVNHKIKCSKPYHPEIQELIIHPLFVKFTRQNDIALVRVTEDIPYSDFIQPICLPLNENILDHWPDYKFTTAGWGRVTNDMADSLPTSNLLQTIQISLIDRSECDAVFTRLWANLERSRLCAGGVAGVGECKGDLGAPLMKSVGIKKNMYQFGILSHSECGQQGVPSVYTNVLSYVPWIVSHMV